MTLNWKNRTFNLTATKMAYWHRHAAHNIQPGCVFCEGDMKKISEYLERHGLQVVDVGHAWVTIRAEKNYRPFHGGMTDESNLLFELVSGRKEWQDRSSEATETLQSEGCDLTCLMCGSLMKVREGRYGLFLGCSNYPKCSFTREIEQRQESR